MAQCKWCDRSGWFLSLNPLGLCSTCSPIIHMEASQRTRIINDSVKVISDSKNLETRLSRVDQLIEHANGLLRYEKRGISVIDPPASSFLEDYGGRHDQIIFEALTADASMALSKANVAPSYSTKINLLSKVLLKIREYKPRTHHPESLDSLERQVQSAIQNVQLKQHLESAKKHEFKGQNKKALDQYYEALYLLRHDDIDDSVQNKHISFIEAKITSLGGSPGK